MSYIEPEIQRNVYKRGDLVICSSEPGGDDIEEYFTGSQEALENYNSQMVRHQWAYRAGMSAGLFVLYSAGKDLLAGHKLSAILKGVASVGLIAFSGEPLINSWHHTSDTRDLIRGEVDKDQTNRNYLVIIS